MIAEPRPAEPLRQPLGRARLVQLASCVLFGALPAIVVLLLFVSAIEDDAVAFDFRVFYGAAEAVLDGDSPYQDPEDENAVVARGYVYPPITAIGGDPVDGPAGRGRGPARHGAARRRGARDPVRPRRARLALLRAPAALAARDLGGADGDGDAAPRARRGARVALSRAHGCRLGEPSARRWR